MGRSSIACFPPGSTGRHTLRGCRPLRNSSTCSVGSAAGNPSSLLEPQIQGSHRNHYAIEHTRLYLAEHPCSPWTASRSGRLALRAAVVQRDTTKAPQKCAPWMKDEGRPTPAFVKFCSFTDGGARRAANGRIHAPALEHHTQGDPGRYSRRNAQTRADRSPSSRNTVTLKKEGYLYSM